MTEAIVYGLAWYGAATLALRYLVGPLAHVWAWNKTTRGQLDYAPFNWRVLCGPKRYFAWVEKTDPER